MRASPIIMANTGIAGNAMNAIVDAGESGGGHGALVPAPDGHAINTTVDAGGSPGPASVPAPLPAPSIVMANALPVGTDVSLVTCPRDGSCAFHALAFWLNQLFQMECHFSQSTITGQHLRDQLADLLLSSPGLEINGMHIARYIALDRGMNTDNVNFERDGERLVSDYANRIRSGLWGGELEVSCNHFINNLY